MTKHKAQTQFSFNSQKEFIRFFLPSFTDEFLDEFFKLDPDHPRNTGMFGMPPDRPMTESDAMLQITVAKNEVDVGMLAHKDLIVMRCSTADDGRTELNVIEVARYEDQGGLKVYHRFSPQQKEDGLAARLFARVAGDNREKTAPLPDGYFNAIIAALQYVDERVEKNQKISAALIRDVFDPSLLDPSRPPLTSPERTSAKRISRLRRPNRRK